MRSPASLALLLLLCVPIEGQQVALAAQHEGAPAFLQSYSGRVDVSVAAYAHPVSGATAGELVVAELPEGSQVLSAWLYTSDWYEDFGPSAAIDGFDLGATSAYGSDVVGSIPGFETLYAFRWDVTAYVTGNGSYSVAAAPLQENYGMALVVVYSHDSLPERLVQIVDRPLGVGFIGSPVVLPELEQVRFPRLPAGPATVTLYTQADTGGPSGEVVWFNGLPVGGPLDGNLGGFGSLLTLEVEAQQGTNVLGVETIDDLFGWHLAVMRSVPGL